MPLGSFRLELLGGASLREPEGPLSGPVVQRRRLAFLVLLERARERGLSRDKIVGYLWSESPGPRARHLLSESIYVIRKALGEDSLLTAGDDIRLNPRVVTSDLAEFEAALTRGDPQGALGLYAGPFLDGFFLQGGVEFERWVERERRHVQRRALEAAWLMVHRSETVGSLDEAVQWGRRAVALSEGDEVAVRRLISLLARAGNRSGALRVYEDLVRELRREYGVKPSPKTTRLIEWIREWGGERPDHSADHPGRTAE